MSSILRIQSSRANGAKSRGPVSPAGKRASAANAAHSTGPVTPEGKARSSRNAIRHAMLSDSVVLDAESAAQFIAHLAILEDELKPELGIETGLVQSMAVASWRQIRLWSLEKMQMDCETRKQQLAHSNEDAATCTALAFRALSDESTTLENLNRYETRYDRQYHRALARFLAFRAGKRNKNKSVFAKRTEPNLG
jgi:hypothetical protein